MRMSCKTLIPILLVTTGLTVACSNQKFVVPTEEKTFGQKAEYNHEVDVLWVVDTSSSMAKHQKLLADQAHLFVDALKDTGLSFHIAVTTMDMGSGGPRGRFLYQTGTPNYLKASTPDLLNLFRGRLMAGESGSPTERGAEAMRAALTEPNSSSANLGFLRPNSLLAVVFLTDEEDKSATINYEAFLDSIRPPTPYGDKSWIAHFLGVTPDDPNCKTAAWDYSSPGHRYIALAQASGGVSETICGADLRKAVTNMRSRILEVMTEFPLGKRIPKVDTIKVVVDGRHLANDSENGWTYNQTKNSIRFHGTGVPRPDSIISIDFDPSNLK